MRRGWIAALLALWLGAALAGEPQPEPSFAAQLDSDGQSSLERLGQARREGDSQPDAPPREETPRTWLLLLGALALGALVSSRL